MKSALAGLAAILTLMAVAACASPTPTAALAPTPTASLPMPTSSPAWWPTPTVWPPTTGTPGPSGGPTACFVSYYSQALMPHPEHFIHWVTTETGDYLLFDYELMFDYKEDLSTYVASDSIGKLLLDTGVAEPIINASPYLWEHSLYADPSPESLIAYTSCEFVTNYTLNKDTEIAVINSETLDRKRLTDSTEYDFFPVWSPDGKHIAFLSWDGFPGFWYFSSESVAINVVNLEGELTASSRGALLHPVAWSPSSDEFAFIDVVGIDEDIDPRRGPIVQIGVFLTGIDEIEPKQIADATSYEHSKFSRQTRLNSITFGGPSWSPNGHEIAFGSSDYDGASVHIVSRDGMNDRVIWQGDSQSPISQVAWSPDGEEILFIAEVARVVRSDGNGLRRLELPYGDGPRQLDLPYEANLRDFDYMEDAWSLSSLRAAWSPDSSQIALYDGRDTIVIMNRDGTGSRIYETPRGGASYEN